MAKYKCSVCGYVFDEEYHGRDFSTLGACPLCAKPKENLVLISEAEEEVKEDQPVGNAVYKCSVCGYIYDEAKEGKPFSTLKECPLCKQPVDKFELISGEPAAPAPAVRVALQEAIPAAAAIWNILQPVRPIPAASSIPEEKTRRFISRQG